eukprot:scaffold84806_cov20-Tisochrysis_lutea.AAC.1
MLQKAATHALGKHTYLHHVLASRATCAFVQARYSASSGVASCAPTIALATALSMLGSSVRVEPGWSTGLQGCFEGLAWRVGAAVQSGPSSRAAVSSAAGAWVLSWSEGGM